MLLCLKTGNPHFKPSFISPQTEKKRITNDASKNPNSKNPRALVHDISMYAYILIYFSPQIIFLGAQIPACLWLGSIVRNPFKIFLLFYVFFVTFPNFYITFDRFKAPFFCFSLIFDHLQLNYFTHFHYFFIFYLPLVILYRMFCWKHIKQVKWGNDL
jgi:hypothetical protein